MNKPNFFIIGAPKCGTTSLAKWLGEHNEIYIPKMKEPNFFSTDIDQHTTKSLREYLNLYKDISPEHIAIGDASTTYLVSKVAIPAIINFNPDAKFIVMLRNPIDMFISLHNELLRNEHECYADLEQAWDAQALRKIGKEKHGRHCYTPAMLQYSTICSLGSQIEKLLQFADKERVLFILLEDMATNPNHEYSRTLLHLKVDNNFRTEFNIMNKACQTKSQSLHYLIRTISDLKWNSRFRNYSTKLGILEKINLLNRLEKTTNKRVLLKPHFRTKLIDNFHNDIKLTSSLIGRDLSHWLEY